MHREYIIACLLICVYVEVNCISNVQIVNGHSHLSLKPSTIQDFPVLTEWDVLAPFPMGPREQGADPLMAYGGITKIPRGGSQQYPSELVNGGMVSWTKVYTSNGQVVINYNDSQVNWDLITDWAGSAGSYLQGWALSDFSLGEPTTVMFACTGPGSIYVDYRLINGDKYGAGIAMTPLYLQAGEHTVRVAVSGSGGIQFTCSILPVDSKSAPLRVVTNDILVSDLVEGELASSYASVVVVNQLNQVIEDVVVSVVNTSIVNVTAKVLSQSTIVLAASQTLPVNFEIEISGLNGCPPLDYPLSVVFAFQVAGFDPCYHKITFNCQLFSEPYVFTFLDFDKSVQYSAVRSPLYPCENEGGCPVILTLHGAGVEASTGAWTLAYRQQNYSWILFPTNRRNYGWDWQGPGLRNALHTLEYFTEFLPGVPSNMTKLYAANKNLVVYAGHSMGGHGCWTISTHYPDRALGVIPAAGWISMMTYQPFFLRIGNSWTDPYVKMLMTAAIADYDDDYYTPHLTGIPLLVRMGSEDDNVPPYHLRRMARLVNELSGDPQYTQISEVPGVGHWFNGVVDDDVMQQFFDTQIRANTTTLPRLPESFTVVTMNPATSEGRGGIRILQLTIPFRGSKIRVNKGQDGKWILKTENIRRFGISPLPGMETPTCIVVDSQTFSVEQLPANYLLQDNKWKLVTSDDWQATERGPLNYGPLEQVLGTRPLLIIYGTKDTLSTVRLELATFIANSLYYQARFCITIVSDNDATKQMLEDNNAILLGGPNSNTFAQQLAEQFPVGFDGNSFSVDDRTYFDDAATGIAFLSKCGTTAVDGLCAVLEGTDESGLRKAVQLLPMVSSVTVPDFAVAGPQWGQSGGAGLLALGFWDNSWKYNPLTGYVTSL